MYTFTGMVLIDIPFELSLRPMDSLCHGHGIYTLGYLLEIVLQMCHDS